MECYKHSGLLVHVSKLHIIPVCVWSFEIELISCFNKGFLYGVVLTQYLKVKLKEKYSCVYMKNKDAWPTLYPYSNYYSYSSASKTDKVIIVQNLLPAKPETKKQNKTKSCLERKEIQERNTGKCPICFSTFLNNFVQIYFQKTRLGTDILPNFYTDEHTEKQISKFTRSFQKVNFQFLDK